MTYVMVYHSVDDSIVEIEEVGEGRWQGKNSCGEVEMFRHVLHCS